jgi:hypothetical protein
MLINNEYGTFVILEDKIFHVENNHIFNTGPISEEDKKEIILTDYRVVFRKNRQLHRNSDLPTIVWFNGTKEWYQNGKLIREEYVDQ